MFISMFKKDKDKHNLLPTILFLYSSYITILLTVRLGPDIFTSEKANNEAHKKDCQGYQIKQTI